MPVASYNLPVFSADFWREAEVSRVSSLFKNVNHHSQPIIQACDDEIVMARAYIQSISTRRNALILVNQLPSEILASIFYQLLPIVKAEIHRSTCDDFALSIASATRSIIAASHVCQRWRGVAVETSILWTTLWISNGPWMREMIKRSQDASLTIVQHSRSIQPPPEGPPTPTSSIKNFESISSDLFRTKQPKFVSLEVSQFDNMSNFEQLITRAAPRLETLVIRVIISPASTLPLPGDLLGRCAPRLTTLVIRGPFTHEALWTSPVLHGLTNLTLYSLPSSGQILSTASDVYKPVFLRDILDALQNMQQLETLSIEFPYLDHRRDPPSYFSQSDVDDCARVHLPRLSVLRLLGNQTDATRLTNHLTIPSACLMRYRVDVHVESSPQLVGIMSKLVSPAEPLEPIETVDLLLFPRSSGSLQMRCWNRDADRQPRLSLDFHLFTRPAYAHHPLPRTPVSSFLQALDAMLASLDLSRLRRLRWAYSWLNHRPALGMNDYHQVLGRFATVETLQFETLFGHRHELNALSIDRSVLPQLKKICFIADLQICDDPAWMSPAPFGVNHNMEEEVRELAVVLLRVAQTRDLEALEFRGCGLSEAQVDGFVGVARHIIIS